MSSDRNYSQSIVPFNKRIGSIALIFVMLGFTLFSSSMWSGGIIGTGLKFWDFVITLLLGSAFLAIYAGLLGAIGVKTGLNTNLLYQVAFGIFGSKIPSLILTSTQTGWFGMGLAMMAIAINRITGIDVRLLILIAGLLISFGVFFGVKGLTVVSIISVPAIVILGSSSLYRSINDMGSFKAITEFIPNSEQAMGLIPAISIVIGNFICGATVVPDFLRYGKKVFISIISCILAFFFGNILMFVFGAFGSISSGTSDISDVMFKQGFLIPGIIVLIMNIWTTNDNTLYVTGLALSNIIRLPSRLCSIINGIVGTLASLWIYNNFTQFLIVLSSLIPPIGGVIIADYYLNKEKYHDFGTVKTSFKPLAFIALITGIVSSRLIPGISAANGILASFFSLIILNSSPVKKLMEKTYKPVKNNINKL